MKNIMDNHDNIDVNLIENRLDFLEKENNRLNEELLAWREYTQKILRLIKTFRNDYVITQTKCINNIEKYHEKNGECENNGDGDGRHAIGFNDFLRGKLHTITEVINDFNIINSIKFGNDMNYKETLDNDTNIETENKTIIDKDANVDVDIDVDINNEPLRILTDEEIKERKNSNIFNFCGINYKMT